MLDISDKNMTHFLAVIPEFSTISAALLGACGAALPIFLRERASFLSARHFKLQEKMEKLIELMSALPTVVTSDFRLAASAIKRSVNSIRNLLILYFPDVIGVWLKVSNEWTHAASVLQCEPVNTNGQLDALNLQMPKLKARTQCIIDRIIELSPILTNEPYLLILTRELDSASRLSLNSILDLQSSLNPIT